MDVRQFMGETLEEKCLIKKLQNLEEMKNGINGLNKSNKGTKK
jgi:hypothetical protein